MHAQEHVLREILGPGAILHRAGDQGEHQILVPIDQLLKSALIACRQRSTSSRSLTGSIRTPY